MSEINQNNYGYSGGDISLVDLATMFVRRVWLFIGFLVLFVVAGVGYALWAPEQFEYVSLYQVAESEPGEPIESPAKAIAILTSQGLPGLESEYRSKNGYRVPFDVSLSNPQDTSLVRIFSRAEKDDGKDVADIHRSLLDQLNARHGILVNSLEQSLKTRIDAVKASMEALKGVEDSGRALAEALQRQAELEGELEALSGGDVLVVARESVERVAPNRKLIVVIAAFLGGVLGIVAVYFAEFASVVRRAMKEPVRNRDSNAVHR